MFKNNINLNHNMYFQSWIFPVICIKITTIYSENLKDKFQLKSKYNLRFLFDLAYFTNSFVNIFLEF